MYKFPFNKSIVEGQWGAKKLSLCRHILSTSLFEPVGEVVLEKTGHVSGCTTGSWEVDKGILTVKDVRDKPSVHFDGLETKNGIVYLDGEMLECASQQGFVRAVMYPYDYMGEHNYDVVVSSHVDYVDITVPRVLRTLHRAGFKGHITVVVCGSRHEKVETDCTLGMDNVTYRYVNWNALGFAGLMAHDIESEAPYMVLLHDTCDVTPEFCKLMSAIDVGAAPDIILAQKDWEVGIYSKSFIRDCGIDIPTAKNNKLHEQLIEAANLWTILPGRPRDAGMKDVYGGGTQRQVFYHDSMGVRKYRTDRATGAKP
jgi:hypothetical protein